MASKIDLEEYLGEQAARYNPSDPLDWERCRLRRHFLGVLSQLYPACAAEREEIDRRPWSSQKLQIAPDGERGLMTTDHLYDWAKKWNLLEEASYEVHLSQAHEPNRRRFATREAANLEAERLNAIGRRVGCPCGDGGCALVSPVFGVPAWIVSIVVAHGLMIPNYQALAHEGRDIEAKFSWNPFLESRREAEKRIHAGFKSWLGDELDRIEKQVEDEGGLRVPLAQHERSHIEWAVRYQCGKVEVATLCGRLSEQAINKAINPIFEKIGLAKRRSMSLGRPQKPAPRKRTRHAE